VLFFLSSNNFLHGARAQSVVGTDTLEDENQDLGYREDGVVGVVRI